MPPSAILRLGLHYETSRNPRRERNPQDGGRAASKRRWVCLASAVVAALGESGALHPNHVIRWATWMAENEPESEAAVSGAASRMLRNFTKILASMMEARPEGPSARN
jgi:hypothetical protein